MMVRWIDIVVVLVMGFGIYAFIELTGFRTRWLTRKSTRTAESMYANYADSPGKQRRYAKGRGGERRDDEASDLRDRPEGNRP
jgi:hypothetical protein